MIAAIRTSRRAMFGAMLGCVFFVVALMVVKDMNNKLSVMTASNSGYQRMTDSQASRINKLAAHLKDAKKAHEKDIDS